MAKPFKLTIYQAKRLKKTLLVSIFLLVLSFFVVSNDDLDKSRALFLKGEYESAIKEASNYDTAEAKILESRILSIYTHFYLKDKAAEEQFLKAYEIAKTAIKIAPENDEAYVEAAHALGRYGQEIGIMAAISEGIADRVKRYLNKALSYDDKNIIANISKGIWHAEIVNQAGKTLARALYSANPEIAKEHFKKVFNQNNNEIGILYELSYGYFLLGEKEDLNLSLKYIEKLLSLDNKSHLDKLYKEKAIKLKNKIL